MATLRLLSKLAAVTLTTAALASGASHAESSKVAYELSDHCTKSARTFFTGLNYTSTALNGVSYEDHYNPTLNSCFLLVIGFKPGMIGMWISFSRHFLTKSKYFWLSKNI